MSDPVLAVLSEVLWDHVDRVLFETKAALHAHGEIDAITALNASAADVTTVFAAIMEPGDPLTLRCRQCGSYPTHACVEGAHGARTVRPHPVRKADLVRRTLERNKSG